MTIVGDDVLDNLTEAIAPMRYQAVRVQSGANSDDWEQPTADEAGGLT